MQGLMGFRRPRGRQEEGISPPGTTPMGAPAGPGGLGGTPLQSFPTGAPTGAPTAPPQEGAGMPLQDPAMGEPSMEQTPFSDMDRMELEHLTMALIEQIYQLEEMLTGKEEMAPGGFQGMGMM